MTTAQAAAAPHSSDNSKTLSILAHVLGWLTGFVGPLILLLVSQDDHVKAHAKASLNWQISFLIYMVVSFILMFIIVGVVTAVVLGIMDVIFCIMAAVKASNGEVYKYPLTIPFFK